jgi:ketosteroid isomerase-like protein
MKTEQTNTPDPQLRQQLDAKYRNYDEAFNNNDAAGMATFFTEDAVLVSDKGPISGREAIEKYYADLFKQFHCSNHIGKPDQYSPHIIGTAGNELWSSGDWSLTLQGETGDPISLKGYWSEIYVREGDAWMVRMQTWNITPPPAAPAETK